MSVQSRRRSSIEKAIFGWRQRHAHNPLYCTVNTLFPLLLFIYFFPFFGEAPFFYLSLWRSPCHSVAGAALFRAACTACAQGMDMATPNVDTILYWRRPNNNRQENEQFDRETCYYLMNLIMFGNGNGNGMTVASIKTENKTE